MSHSSETAENEIKEEDSDIDIDNESNSNGNVTLPLMQSAYKFYAMKAMSCDIKRPLDFVLGTFGKATYEEPLQVIYQALQNTSLKKVVLPFTIKQLCIKLGTFDEKYNINLRERLRVAKKPAIKELYRKLLIIYYNVVFDDKFRELARIMFDQAYIDKQIITLNMDHNGARITNGIMMYPGNSCIECNNKLSVIYQDRRDGGSKGSVAIAYHKTSSPKLCTSYQKKCDKCHIYYNYNKIDYMKNAKNKARQNATLFLDPDALPYYSIAGKSTRNFIHQSIHRSLKHHQYCNKATSIIIWLQHYNEDFKADYDELLKIKDVNRLMSSAELGYSYILRYFYLYSLLCRIRDIENYGSININGDKVKIALIVTDEDKKKMEKELNTLSNIKNYKTKNDKTTNDEAADNKATDAKTTKGDAKASQSRIRAQQQYFGYFVRKYNRQLIETSVDELKEVPIRFNDDGAIEIYPGWFIVYGDGAEKITRLRCAYPAILGKLDYMKKIKKNDINEEMKINDIEKDDNDIDLAINNNAGKYSAQRYYECDGSPYFNDSNNNKKSYKCCKQHIAKIVKHFEDSECNMDIADVTSFINWYQINTAIARMRNTNVQKTIKATYTIDEDALSSIKKKHQKKLMELELKASKFASDNPEKQLQFEKFVDDIHIKMKSYKIRTLPDRECKNKGKSEASRHAALDKKQQLCDKLRIMLGDNDFDTDVIDEMIKDNETSVIDLLNLEFNYNRYMDKYGGCRRSKNITGATTARTKGLNVFMNCAGIIIKLREEIIRETPTAVILDIAESCTNNKTIIQYANRIEAIGYDMICRMYHHLKTLVNNERLPAIQEAFWCDLIWRAFIDIWHIFTHTDELCNKEGTFHPTLPKFENILFDINILMDRVNDVIAEQFWSTMNATLQLKSMCKERFILFLIEKREYHNKAKYDEIKNQGWTFIPIEWCTTLRDIKKAAKSEATFPTEQELKDKNGAQLSRITIRWDKMDDVRKLIRKANSGVNTPKNNKKRRMPQSSSKKTKKGRR